MWKKFQTAVLLLTVTMGSGLIVSSYIKARPVPTPSSVSMILRGDDVIQPEKTAKVVIQAQEIAEIGELVRFNLSESTAQSFKWLMVPEAVDFEVYDDGRRAVFSAREAGDYLFIVACACDGAVDVAIHIVTVEEPIEPPPIPDDPVTPDDEYPNVSQPAVNATLDKWTAYWCSANKLPQDETERLAASFESIAAQIASGVLQKADDIIKATADVNREALGESLSDWLPVLRELQIAMQRLAGQGQLSNPDQHQALWLEIAKGLRQYVSLFE
jgi:hypothetical protein